MSKILPQLNLFEATPIELPLPEVNNFDYPEAHILQVYYAYKQESRNRNIIMYCWQGRVIVTGDDIAIVAKHCTIKYCNCQKFVEFDQQYLRAYRLRLNNAGYLVSVAVPLNEKVPDNI